MQRFGLGCCVSVTAGDFGSGIPSDLELFSIQKFCCQYPGVVPHSSSITRNCILIISMALL
eukprot:1914346-Rhodomonas_salina.1